MDANKVAGAIEKFQKLTRLQDRLTREQMELHHAVSKLSESEFFAYAEETIRWIDRRDKD